MILLNLLSANTPIIEDRSSIKHTDLDLSKRVLPCVVVALTSAVLDEGRGSCDYQVLWSCGLVLRRRRH